MLILGLSGAPELISEHLYGFSTGSDHDSASVLLEDGKIICAIEEERLNRIKHTNKFPCQSLRFCLKTHGIQLQDVDLIAFYSSMENFETWLKQLFLKNTQLVTIEPITFFQDVFRRGFNCEIAPDKLCFVLHHYAHAMSAFAFSGYESSLISVMEKKIIKSLSSLKVL